MKKQYTVENISEMINETINKHKIVLVNRNGILVSYAQLVYDTVMDISFEKGVDNMFEHIVHEKYNITQDNFRIENTLLQEFISVDDKKIEEAYKSYIDLVKNLCSLDKDIIIQSMPSSHSARYFMNQAYGFSKVPAEVAGIITNILIKNDCKIVKYKNAEDISICRSFSSHYDAKLLQDFKVNHKIPNIADKSEIDAYVEELANRYEKSGIRMITSPYGDVIDYIYDDFLPFITDGIADGDENYNWNTLADANIRVYYKDFDDFVDDDFSHCIEHSLDLNNVSKKAIIIIPTNWLRCQIDNEYSEQDSLKRSLNKLYNGRHIETIIELPDGTINHGESHSILVIDVKGGLSSIKFINATECWLDDVNVFMVDSEPIIENLYSEKEESDIMKTYKYWDYNNYAYCLIPHIWAPICYNNQSRYLISDLVNVYSKECFDLAKEQGENNPSLKPENVLSFYDTHHEFYDVIVDPQREGHSDEYVKYNKAIKGSNPSYKVEKLEPSSIIVEDKLDCSLRLYKKGDACYISTGMAFHTKENLVTPEYLIHVLMDRDMDMPFTYEDDKLKYKLFLSVPVVIYDSISTQISLVESALKQEFDERLKALSADQDRFSIRSAAADIQHMLGTPFSQQQVCMELIKRSKDEATYKKNVAALIDISGYIQRVVTSVGADIASAEFNPKDVELIELVKQYITSYGNFSSGYFKVSYAEGNADKGVAYVDEDMIKLLLDTIMDNAGRHGFGKKSDKDNLVQVRLDFYKYKDHPYYRISVMNNGKPKNPDYSVRDFISRANFDGESGRTGLGGYHIHQIARKHNGFVGIDSSKEWGFIVNVLIPVKSGSKSGNVKYITDDKEYV